MNGVIVGDSEGIIQRGNGFLKSNLMLDPVRLGLLIVPLDIHKRIITENPARTLEFQLPPTIRPCASTVLRAFDLSQSILSSDKSQFRQHTPKHKTGPLRIGEGRSVCLSTI